MRIKKKLKILIVALPDSIHTTRWINQIIDQDWEIHLFPAVDLGVTHRDFRNITIHHSFYSRRENPSTRVKYRGISTGKPLFAKLGRSCLGKFIADYRAKQLARLIKKIKPDIIHSLEFSLAGYLVLEARKILKGKFPKWIATNWGSDIYLFARLEQHKLKVTEVLQSCDFYSCECQRDICLAKDHGLGIKSKILPVFPNTGGFNLGKVKKLRQPGKVSSRKLIMLKGYQNMFGRVLFGLKALEKCADLLRGYKIAIYSTTPGAGVEVAVELFTHRTGIPTEIIPLYTSHEKILKHHGRARIYLGLSISDAISTSLLESMVMGAFPIQSNTSCADEWIKNGKTGILVPPEDPAIIEMAIRNALTDDKLVDEAAKINWKTAIVRLDEKILKKKAVDFYLEVNSDLKNINKSESN